MRKTKNKEKENEEYEKMTDLEKMRYNLEWAAHENEKTEKLSRLATTILILGWLLVIFASLPLS